MATKRVAIVTGGTKGIGRGISEALAEDGFDLLLNYNSDKESAMQMVADLTISNPQMKCALVGGDISLKETRSAIFSAFDKMEGEPVLGVMVHNAGQYLGLTSTNMRGLGNPTQRVLGHGSSDGIDLSHIEYYQAMYGNAFIDLCERSIARMSAEVGGTLIGISSPGCNITYSVNTMHAMPSSGKCVMENACRLIAKTAAAKNVNCNIVIPGITISKAWDKIAETMNTNTETLMNKQVQFRVPMKRFATPRQIGDVVAFLSGSKGRYITGVAFPVDGGLHLC